MKKQHSIQLVLASAFLAASLAGCSSSNKITIGILQPVEHGALAAAREGFKAALAKEGFGEDKVEFVYRNAGGKDADLVSFAKDLVGRCDMTFGLGTGASQNLRSAALDKGKTNPILFSAVTDPVDAGLVESLANGKGFITGTSDINPVEAQVSLIKDVNPNADKVGILYTQSESNSVVQANKAKVALENSGIQVTIKTATNATDVSAASSALASVDGIDAIYIPTDNNIAANADAVKSAVQGKNIIVVAGEEDMLKKCGSITLSVNYTNLGQMTGKMAADILSKKKNPAQIPVGFMGKEDCEYVYSSVNAAAAGVEIPAEIVAKCRDLNA